MKVIETDGIVLKTMDFKEREPEFFTEEKVCDREMLRKQNRLS